MCDRAVSVQIFEQIPTCQCHSGCMDPIIVQHIPGAGEQDQGTIT